MARKKPDETPDLAPFLKSLYLFSGMDDERIARLASEFEFVPVEAGDTVYQAGDPGDAFYLVYEGKVSLRTARARQPRDWDILVPGDIFGEDLLLAPYRSDQAVALLPAQLLRLEKDRFLALLGENPRMQRFVRTAAESRRMARRERVSLGGTDEAVYFIGRKHEYFLLIQLIFPILLAVAAVPILSIAFGSGSLTWGVLAGLMALSAGAWGLWVWEDWRNDYYIVTSQRVLWLEKILLLYDSRQEAPLVTILSKNVAFHQVLRRIINYGTVIVRTYTGSIVLRRAANPDLMIAIIDALQTRARLLVRKAEEEKMEALLRERLNLEPRSKPSVVLTPSAAPPPARPSPTRSSPVDRMFSNFFKLRFEQGDRITYRKHWFDLIRRTLWPTLSILGTVVLLVFVAQAGWLTGLPLAAAAFILLPALFLWWLYHYVDWRNDQYAVTLDTILDINRKPLSREEKKSAPLDNILSLEHSRVGILALLLNFGTVTINVGTEKFNFYNVYNPAQVQYEIFDRMVALRRRKEENEARKERDRIVDWLTTYHNQIERSEVDENNSDWDVL